MIREALFCSLLGLVGCDAVFKPNVQVQNCYVSGQHVKATIGDDKWAERYVTANGGEVLEYDGLSKEDARNAVQYCLTMQLVL